MLRTGQVAEAGTPHVGGEIEAEEAEEKAGDFEPEDAADAAKGAQKASDSTACCACEPVRILADLADLLGVIGGRYGLCRSSCRGCGILGFGPSRFLSALLGDASCDAYSDAQFFSNLVGVHPHLEV